MEFGDTAGLETCATTAATGDCAPPVPDRRALQPRSAEFHSAVSRISNPLASQEKLQPSNSRRPAEWNSATQQIGNLRHAALRTEFGAAVDVAVGAVFMIETLTSRL